MDRSESTNDNRTPGFRLARGALIIAGVALLFWIAGDALMALFAALLAAIFLHGLAGIIDERTRLSQSSALLVAILALTSLTVAGVWLATPRVAGQLEQLSHDLPESLDRLTSTVRQYEWGRWVLRQAASIEGAGPDGRGGNLDELGRAMTGRLAAVLGGYLSFAARAVAYFVVVVAIGVYVAADFRRYKRGFLGLIPPDKRDRAAEVLQVSVHTLEGWLLGQAVSMTVLGVCSFIGLSLLGVPLALTFALLTALLTFVPNIGPFLSVVPPALLGLMESPMTSLYVMGFYLVLQNAEGLLITPMVQQRTASVPPPLLLAAQVLMAATLGFYGLLLAAPLCAVTLVLVQLLYVEDRLGEPVEIPGYSPKPKPQRAVTRPSGGAVARVETAG